MTLSSTDITILPEVKAITGQKQRLYYYQGNFFGNLNLHGSENGRVKRAIREFTKANEKLIRDDRSSPDYRDLVQLAQLER